MLYQKYEPPFWIPEIGEMAFLHDTSWEWLFDENAIRHYGEIPWEYGHAIDPIYRTGELVYFQHKTNEWQIIRIGGDFAGTVYLLALDNLAHDDGADYCIVKVCEEDIIPMGR